MMTPYFFLPEQAMAERLRVLKDLQCTPQTLKKAESWLRCDVGGMQCAVPQPVLTAYFQSIVEFGDGASIEQGDKGGANFIDIGIQRYSPTIYAYSVGCAA